jgi:thiamine-phosphate pyrophosphorylase
MARCRLDLTVILAAITDRKSLDEDPLLFIERALAAGIDWIQIREKGLSGQALFELCRRAAELPNPRGTKLFVNGRADVALGAALDGVHLPSDAPAAADFRKCVGARLRIGVSCHSLEEVRAAEQAGADYAFYAPIFASSSKPGYGPALGLDALARVCAAVKIPVLALGGVSAENAHECVAVGAAGVAGISLFQSADDLPGMIARLRRGP